MKKIFSFLGTGDYQKTKYLIAGNPYETAFVQDALTRHFKPDACYIALTPTVKKSTKDRDGNTKTSNWSLLKLESPFAYEGLDISEAQTSEAHFEILETITSVIDKNDDLILDITHSFRSIPMVALTAAFYLKATNKVNSLKIYYGGFQLGAATSPIHELTGLLDIMEWVNAAQVFQRFGDGSDFAKLLQQSHTSAWQEKGISPSEKPRTLQNYASQLISASNALSANQPKSIAEAARSMNNLKESVQQEIASYAKPFTNVFEDVHAQLTDFVDLDLPTQKRLIHWYASRGRLLEASQLAREWMVTYIARHLKIMTESPSSLFDDKIRQQAEYAIGQCYSRDYSDNSEKLSPLAQQLSESPIYVKIMAAWGDFIETRNTFSHCGFNSSSHPVPTLKKKVIEWVSAIDALPL